MFAKLIFKKNNKKMRHVYTPCLKTIFWANARRSDATPGCPEAFLNILPKCTPNRVHIGQRIMCTYNYDNYDDISTRTKSRANAYIWHSHLLC